MGTLIYLVGKQASPFLCHEKLKRYAQWNYKFFIVPQNVHSLNKMYKRKPVGPVVQELLIQGS